MKGRTKRHEQNLNGCIAPSTRHPGPPVVVQEPTDDVPAPRHADVACQQAFVIGIRFETLDAPLDAEFLELAARDDAAFTEIRRRFNRLVWAASFGFGFDRHTREDIGQLVWLKLFQNLTTIRDPSRLAGWLATTTRRECLRLVRSRARSTMVGSFDSDDAVFTDRAVPEVDAAIIRDETVRLVARALNDLDEECRRLLRLLSTEPVMSYEQIATTLHASPGSIGPWRQRCLRKLATRPELRRAIGSTARPPRGGAQ